MQPAYPHFVLPDQSFQQMREEVIRRGAEQHIHLELHQVFIFGTVGDSLDKNLTIEKMQVSIEGAPEAGTYRDVISLSHTDVQLNSFEPTSKWVTPPQRESLGTQKIKEENVVAQTRRRTKKNHMVYAENDHLLLRFIYTIEITEKLCRVRSNFSHVHSLCWDSRKNCYERFATNTTNRSCPQFVQRENSFDFPTVPSASGLKERANLAGGFRTSNIICVDMGKKGNVTHKHHPKRAGNYV